MIQKTGVQTCFWRYQKYRRFQKQYNSHALLLSLTSYKPLKSSLAAGYLILDYFTISRFLLATIISL